MPVELGREEFEELVADALDEIPDEIASLISNVVVLVKVGHMSRIPHDMAHMAAEAHLGIDHGFWGLLARGATYSHGTRQRPTQTGRRIIRENRAALGAAEGLGNHHHFAWAQGEPTPVAPTFDRLAALWEATADGATLTVQWPSLDVVDT